MSSHALSLETSVNLWLQRTILSQLLSAVIPLLPIYAYCHFPRETVYRNQSPFEIMGLNDHTRCKIKYGLEQF